MRLHIFLAGLMALGPMSGDIRTPARVSNQDFDRLAVNYRTALRVEEWGCHHEHDVIVTEGLIRNLTQERLGRILAIVAYYTTDGTLLSSEKALILHRPILPGERFPFKITAKGNPSIQRCSIDFRTSGGDMVGWILADQVNQDGRSSVNSEDIRRSPSLYQFGARGSK